MLNWGDSLTKIIENGLKKPAYGVLVLSKPFLNKLWSRRELDGLAALRNKNLLMMIWRNITQEEVAQYSEALAHANGPSADEGATAIATQIIDTITPFINGHAQPAVTEPYLPQPGTLSASNQPQDLAKLLMHSFSESEIRDIYFHFGIDFREDEYTKGERIHYLLVKMQRQGKIDRLLDMLKQIKPSIDWDTALANM